MSKVIDNIGWLSFEKIFRAFIGAIMTIFLSNQIGAFNFGIYTLLASVLGVCLVFSSMGVKSVVIKYFVTNEYDNKALTSSAIIILLLGSSLVSILAVIFFIVTDHLNGYEILLAIYIFAIYVNVTSIANFWIESQKMHKYNVFAGLSAFTFFAIFKVICVYFEFDTIFLLASIALEIILQGVIIVLILFRNIFTKSSFHLDKKVLIDVAKESLPYWITASIVMINIRIDQYFLAYLLDIESVAIYSIAARFAELLWFVPVVICSSIFPKLIDLHDKSSSKEFYEYFKNVICFLFLVSLILSIMLFASSKSIITLFFNPEYVESAFVMSILAFSLIPLALGSVGSQYIVLKKFGVHNIYRSITALITNVGLNLILIPIYGTIGAAIALVISQFSSSFLIDIFFLKTRQLFFLKLNAFNLFHTFKRSYKFLFIDKELLKF